MEYPMYVLHKTQCGKYYNIILSIHWQYHTMNQNACYKIMLNTNIRYTTVILGDNIIGSIIRI